MISGVILAVGLGSATAQDIFVTQKKNGDSDAQPTVFNSVKPNAFTEQQAVVKYGARLNVDDQINKSKLVAGSLEEMREIGFEPSTTEEMLLYANAHRAVHQSYMYERRKALQAHLEKKKIERVKRDLLRNSPRAALKVNSQSSSSNSSSNAQDPETSTKKIRYKRNPIFVKKSAEEKAKPTKVFKDY